MNFVSPLFHHVGASAAVHHEFKFINSRAYMDEPKIPENETFEICDFTEEIMEIDALGNLEENWDSEGAEKINEPTIQRSIALIKEISNFTSHIGGKIDFDVGPGPDSKATY